MTGEDARQWVLDKFFPLGEHKYHHLPVFFGKAVLREGFICWGPQRGKPAWLFQAHPSHLYAVWETAGGTPKVSFYANEGQLYADWERVPDLVLLADAWRQDEQDLSSL
jgi:hypothetical protein